MGRDEGTSAGACWAEITMVRNEDTPAGQHISSQANTVL